MGIKGKIPSAAQAKQIAFLWSRERPVAIMVGACVPYSVYNAPTVMALVKNGWIAPDGAEYHENNRIYVRHELTDSGVDALERFLFKQRCDRPSKER